MARALVTTDLPYGTPGYGGTPTAGGAVLGVQIIAVGSDNIAFVVTEQVVNSAGSVYPTKDVSYMAGFFGDYYNKLYITPPQLSLIDPIVDSPNRFYFWNTNFETVHFESVAGTDDDGLTIDATPGLTLGDIKLTPANLLVGADAPEEETATYVFTFDNGQHAPWRVTLLRTNLLAIIPEQPIKETLKWKTDVIKARDGTEQRIGTMQFCRVEHEVTYNIQNDDDMRTMFDQLASGAGVPFAYPLWAEQTRLKADAVVSDSNILIDLSVFDAKVGDSLYLENGKDTSEIVKVQSIGLDNTTITLSSGLQNDWSKTDHVYRITQTLLPAKPQMKRHPWGQLEAVMTLRITEGRDLFSAGAAVVEIAQTTILGDRVLTTDVHTLAGIPVLHARPIVDGSSTEDFDWNFEVVDFETGAITYFSDQATADVTWQRKFLINNPTKKFYWNFMLNYMHGQRRPVWLPTWMDDFGDTILNVAGNTLVIQGEKYATHYPAESPFRGLWFSFNGGWFPRAIIGVSTTGDGNTQVLLSGNVPDGYPTTPPGPVGYMNLCRQATDEVQRDLYPFYTMLSTSFVGTKDSPEAP